MAGPARVGGHRPNFLKLTLHLQSMSPEDRLRLRICAGVTCRATAHIVPAVGLLPPGDRNFWLSFLSTCAKLQQASLREGLFLDLGESWSGVTQSCFPLHLFAAACRCKTLPVTALLQVHHHALSLLTGSPTDVSITGHRSCLAPLRKFLLTIQARCSILFCTSWTHLRNRRHLLHVTLGSTCQHAHVLQHIFVSHAQKHCVLSAREDLRFSGASAILLPSVSSAFFSFRVGGGKPLKRPASAALMEQPAAKRRRAIIRPAALQRLPRPAAYVRKASRESDKYKASTDGLELLAKVWRPRAPTNADEVVAWLLPALQHVVVHEKPLQLKAYLKGDGKITRFTVVCTSCQSSTCTWEAKALFIKDASELELWQIPSRSHALPAKAAPETRGRPRNTASVFFAPWYRGPLRALTI